jgi:hypothetical protein
VARHAEGKEAWNAWANGMLPLKSVLEEAGKWDAEREHSWEPLRARNGATRAWLALACAIFSTTRSPRQIEDNGLLDGYTPDRDAAASFRELRRRAAEAQDRDRELEFFAQEIRTGRFHAKGMPSWVPKVWSWRFWFGLGFGAFSDFGRSLWRPLLSWLALTAVFAAVYLGEHEQMRQARVALAPSGAFSTLATFIATTRDALVRAPACRVQGREPFDSTDAVTEAIQLSLRNALVFDIGRASLLDGVSDASYRLGFRYYGRDAVLGPLEPERHIIPREVGVMIEVVADTQQLAAYVLSLARSSYLHCPFDGRKTTAGNLAFASSPSDARRSGLRVQRLSPDGR